jgi:uncharacterized membrane protein
MFEVGVVLKGIDGVLEVIGAALLVVFTPDQLGGAMRAVAERELTAHPHDPVTPFLARAADHLSVGGQRFAAIYLLSHGVLKIALVAALLRSKAWAYPIAIAVFVAFGLYQMWNWAHTRSAAMLALTVLDVFVIWLTVVEWRRVREGRAAAGATAG